jgi:hypothetical protein
MMNEGMRREGDLFDYISLLRVEFEVKYDLVLLASTYFEYYSSRSSFTAH